MNSIESKGRSPFYPDQPVPVELFRGRKAQIERILQRGVGQVAPGACRRTPLRGTTSKEIGLV
jgi:hypothetical protein